MPSDVPQFHQYDFRQGGQCMKIIRNKYIPFGGYLAVNLFGVLFVKGNAYISEQTINHESIHTAKMKEMLYVFFYLWYVVEWVIKIFVYRNAHKAYRNISFEREAYRNQSYSTYLHDRKRYSWYNYL